MRRNLCLFLGLPFIVLVVAGAVSNTSAKKSTVIKATEVRAPIFVVDPFWPKPLPHHWVTGSTIGVSVDAHGNVWTIHRPQSVPNELKAADLHLGTCCKVAPPIIEYDEAGTLVNAWGGPGPGYRWPDSLHGITVDHNSDVWIGGNGLKDTEILKFTSTGKFLMQLGTYGVHRGSNDLKNFWRPAKIFEDPTANEVYIADGYGNRRVIVLDENTGKVKRYWGAYGKKPNDEKNPPYNPSARRSKDFSTVHCVIVSNDGFVYVCDRVNDRIQVFRKNGTFVKEVLIDPQTLRSGSVWDMAFSSDPHQTYLYLANGVDEEIHVLLRSTLQVLTSFGDGGRQPGEFFGCHSIATDSKGNLYVAETYSGARVQRFLYKGVGLVKRNQGVLWPKGE